MWNSFISTLESDLVSRHSLCLCWSPNIRSTLRSIPTVMSAWPSNRNPKRGKYTSPSARRLALWRNDSLQHLPKSLHLILRPPTPGKDLVKAMTFRIIPREGKTNKPTKDSIRYWQSHQACSFPGRLKVHGAICLCFMKYPCFGLCRKLWLKAGEKPEGLEIKKEKASPVLTKDTCSEASSPFPPLPKTWVSDRRWGKWGVARCDSRALTTRQNSERPCTQAGALGIPVPIPSEKIPECYPCHIRINWTPISHALSACQDLFHSSWGRQDSQGRVNCRKRKQTPRPTLANTTAWSPGCSVDFFPPVQCTPGAAGYFPSCEKDCLPSRAGPIWWMVAEG